MGFYAAPPGRRMPWDRDGSALIYIDGTSGVITTRSQAERQALNDEGESTLAVLGKNTGKFAIVFPIPQTIVGVFTANNAQGGNTSMMQYSLDTTTGNDGTWTTLYTGAMNLGLDVNPGYRTNIVTTGLPVASVKGMRWYISGIGAGSVVPTAFHLYGYPTSPSNRLMLWHPTLNQPLSDTPAIYELGDIPRGTGAVVFPFRVKNISATLTAQTVTVLREALTDGTPSMVSLTQLRYNGGAYGNTAAVGNLAPGAVSSLVEASMLIDSTAPVGPWAPRIIAAAASWV